MLIPKLTPLIESTDQSFKAIERLNTAEKLIITEELFSVENGSNVKVNEFPIVNCRTPVSKNLQRNTDSWWALAFSSAKLRSIILVQHRVQENWFTYSSFFHGIFTLFGYMTFYDGFNSK